MTGRGVAAALASVGLAALATFMIRGNAGAAQDATLHPDDMAIVALGREIYAAQCASCHGARLEGAEDWQVYDPARPMAAPPHDETGHTWHHDGETLFRLTKYGVAATIGDPDYRSDMPAYAGMLGDAEIVAVLSFIKSTWPPDIRERHDKMEENQ